jgi:hypothetical protein
VIAFEAVFVALGGALFAMNVVATRRLWASAMFERGQKIAQTALLWLLPGSVFLIWAVVREPTIDRRHGSSNSSIDDAVDWITGAEGIEGANVGHHDHGDHSSHADGHGGFDGHGH